MNQNSKQYLSLAIVLLTAFVVRMLGIFHDFPYTYFGDEEHFIRRAVSFGSGDLNPHWFHKPALYMYLLFFEYGVFFLIGMVLGVFGSVDDFARHFFTDISAFLFIGRLTTVLFSVGTIYFTYRIGKELRNAQVGLFAALFLTFSLGHFASSIVVKADVPSTFFAVVSLLFILFLYRSGHIRDYVLAGLFAGLGMATKYYPITMLVPMYVSHLLSKQHSHNSWYGKFVDSKMFAGIFACFGGFFIGSPFNVLDSTWIRQKGDFLLNLHKVGSVDAKAGYVANTTTSLWDKVQSIFISIKSMAWVVVDSSGMGLLVGCLSLLGLFLFLRDWDHKGLVCLSAIASFAVIASVYNPSYSSSRHLNMLYPMLSLSAGLVVEWIFSSMFAGVQSLSFKRLGVWGICFLLILPGGILIARFDYSALNKDTRLLGKEWIEKNIPAGSKILVDTSGPKLNMSRENLQHFYKLSMSEAEVGAFTTHLEKFYRYSLEAVQEPSYDLTEIYHPWWLASEIGSGTLRLDTEKDLDMGNPLKARGVMPYDFYRVQGFEYVVTDRKTYESYLQEPRKTRFPSMYGFYRDLIERGVLVKEFTPDEWSRRGPIVQIFRLQTLTVSNSP